VGEQAAESACHLGNRSGGGPGTGLSGPVMTAGGGRCGQTQCAGDQVGMSEDWMDGVNDCEPCTLTLMLT
jgi:hypothetical protein